MAKWTAIVLTCPNENCSVALQRELDLRQKKGEIDNDVILLTVEDPKSEVGSGGATLNALLVVAEHISAKQGYTVVNGDVLSRSLILIIHMGRTFPFDPCGRAFVCIPMEEQEKKCKSLTTNLDLLLQTMSTQIAVNSPPGVWVCSSDMFLSVKGRIDAQKFEGVEACVISVPSTLEYAANHGIYKINDKGLVENIYYRCKSDDLIRQCISTNGFVSLVSGVVYFGVKVAEKLLSFHVLPPLDSCTYIGLDSGTHSIELSLFFDVMLAMCTGVSQESFLVGGTWGGSGDLQNSAVFRARSLIWDHLRSYEVHALLLDGKHSYMDLSAATHQRHLLRLLCHSFDDQLSASTRCHSYVESQACVHETAVLINSFVENLVHVDANTVVSHSDLGAALQVGKNSIIGCLTKDDITITNAKFKDDIILQSFRITLSMSESYTEHRILVILGLHDKLEAAETYCNEKFSIFLKRSGIEAEDLWDSSLTNKGRTLLNARLFPCLHAKNKVGLEHLLWLQGSADDATMLQKWRSSWRLSLEEILTLVDVSAHFSHRREIFYQIGSAITCNTLLNCLHYGLNNLYRSAVIEGFSKQFLKTLDKVGMECGSAGVAARILANIADVLGAMSMDDGGLRSGPASNQQWHTAFQLLEKQEIEQGFRAMAVEREHWVSKRSYLVHAARHYEKSAQILIRHAVMSAREFIRTRTCDLPPMNKWVTAECPARIDITGGWSDTPPITYEHGGAMLNAAITLNGQRPIGAKVRRIDSLHIILHIEKDETIVLSDLSDLKDYNQPQVPGALLKAALICAEIVQYPSTLTLEDQLGARYKSGFEVFTWSNLPYGSGLGTSSILAGAIMSAFWKASGKAFDINSLNHAVLHLEQLLTTGGGWQDQVGGLIPGIKVGHSKAELPLLIDVKFINVSPETVQAFSDRLVLVYTGKTRLARNLLQNVIRNWYARNPQILQTEDHLVETVWKCADAFERGDLASVGCCMTEYWEQKKIMAPGCEPAAVSRMMKLLQSHCHGMSMAGAGGGGFMYLLTKQPNQAELVRHVLKTVEEADNTEVYTACVDPKGLVLDVEDSGTVEIPFRWDN